MPQSKKLWVGVTDGKTDVAADSFNSSISFDSRMFREDICGSVAHAQMLARQGIISPEERDLITDGLDGILNESGAIKISPDAEDIHMFVEQVLTERIGDSGKKLHTARSRNDQVALDIRMYLRGQIDAIKGLLKDFLAVLTDRAEQYRAAIMPGYTHLQRAQPITFGHQLMAYAMMLVRDTGRLNDCRARMNVSPIGSCALAGTTYHTDRAFEAKALGFDGICLNSLDGVSDRDFCIELLSCLSIIMMHLSRFAEELILWSSREFGFVTLSGAYTTGSSIMPQKRNPDMAELARGKTGRVYGDLITLLTVMKGLPLAYNKDMQEDKEPVFDACDTVKACLDIFRGMVSTLTANTDKMREAAGKGFINATDYADYLVGKGIPFRDAYKIAGMTVRCCEQNGNTLETLPLDDYVKICSSVGEDVYEAVNLDNCVSRRTSDGGTCVRSVEKQIEYVKDFLKTI